MKRVIIILFGLICLISCGQKPKTVDDKSFDDLVEGFDRMLADSTADWKQLIKLAHVFVDSLDIYASDENDLKKRIIAQNLGYNTILVLPEKYDMMAESGQYVNFDDIPPLLDKVHDAINKWFFYDDGQVTHFWRDHYYVCHQNSENPVIGYFHFMIILPCETYPEATLKVFYPDAAEDDPILIFSKYLNDDDIIEDTDNREVIHPEVWMRRGEGDTDLPMNVQLGPDAVKKMLDYDVLYLMFRSSESRSGDPAEIETARLALAPLKAKMRGMI